MADSDCDLVVIGAGPAGITAGLYSVRAGLRSIVLERALPGGQMNLTDSIENYPAFPNGIRGSELAELMVQQLRSAGGEIRNQSAEALQVLPGKVLVRISSGEITARIAIVATGSEPLRLGVPGEERMLGRGVSYCAVCDGPLFREREVAVVGGGDAALTEAIYLSKICRKVYLVHRRNEFRAVSVLQQRVRATPVIEPVLETVVQEIRGENRVETIILKNLRNGMLREIALSGVFVAIGNRPNTGWLQGVVELDPQGYVITDGELVSSHPSILAAGDCRVKPLRQVVTAVSDGALAADTAARHLALEFRTDY